MNYDTAKNHSPSNLTYLPALTGVRAIAAYMVYCVHFDPFEQYQHSTDGLARFAYTFFQKFGIGVTLFFVLSGFLITLRYAGTIRLEWDWFKRYITNRVARIYPMYFLVTAVTFIVFSYDASYDYMGQYRQFDSVERLFTQFLNFSLLRGFSDNFKFTGVAQGWSLTVEECFYLSAPIFLLGIGRNAKRIFIYPALLLLLGSLATIIFSRLHIYGIFDNFNFLFSFTFFGRCVEFFIGMALALYLKRSPWTEPAESGKYTFAGIIGILACVAVMTLVDLHVQGITGTIIQIALNNLLLPVIICVFYLGLIFENNFITRILKTSTFDLLGKSSYTFYLIHLGVLQTFIHRYIAGNSLVIFLLLNLISIFLFKAVEEPCHRWIKSLSQPAAKPRLA